MRGSIFLVFSLFVCFKIGVVTATYEGKESWSYVKVRKDAYMFWWLMYADDSYQDYKSAPLLIWLQGGPGGSSTGFGNFMEIGPLDVNLKPRNSTWVKFANVLFIDNPVGTGYSYVNNSKAYATNNSQIANDLVTLMAVFFNKLPEFQKVPLYIFSESYGGKMAASFALALYKECQAGKIPCNLQGVAMGDGWLSPLDSTSTWAQYLYSMSLLDRYEVQLVNKAVGEIHQAITSGRLTKATELWQSAQNLVEDLTYGINWYNILTPLPNEKLSPNVTLPYKHPLYRTFQRLVAPYHGDALYNLMNGYVKQKLGVIPKNVTWGGQSNEVFSALMGDFMRPDVQVVDKLLNETNLKVVIYSGQLDLIVDTMGTLQWVNQLDWPGIQEFRQAKKKPMTVGKFTSAFYKSYKNLVMFWILKAGHMVPRDAPQSAIAMVQMILAGKV
ncbi:retinoid-inducible serine carboxypeptidase-like [Ornithodoros turicata]|uniref:retinoid-inducible serine carboxypeptidase-like n=1 Tax=Ornithodoros turicata TaxID=34597 RepID=UPI003138F216